MGTKITTWQIIEGRLQAIETNLANEGRTEPYDLEPWIASNPTIIGDDILMIGRQVSSKSGPIDLLALDKAGNTVIIEMKRDKLPREALAQAIDYASDVADWGLDKLSEICAQYTGKNLEEAFNEAFPEVESENLNINNTQRIILVGFAIESSLERMIEWLSDNYTVNINAIILHYTKTTSGDELLAKTTIISEELAQERVTKQKKFQIPMSDDPGTHDTEHLKRLLIGYLSRSQITNQRIKNILLPACLKKKTLTRDQLKKEFLEYDPTLDPSKVGYYLTLISSQVGMKKNDFLRQIIEYEYPKNTWEKDNYQIREPYKDLVKEVLHELEQKTL